VIVSHSRFRIASADDLFELSVRDLVPSSHDLSSSLPAVGGAMDDLGAVVNSVEQLAYGDEEWSLQPPLSRDSGLVQHSLAIVGSGDQARIVAFGGLDGNYNFQPGSESRQLLEQVRGWETVTLDSPVFELEEADDAAALGRSRDVIINAMRRTVVA